MMLNTFTLVSVLSFVGFCKVAEHQESDILIATPQEYLSGDFICGYEIKQVAPDEVLLSNGRTKHDFGAGCLKELSFRWENILAAEGSVRIGASTCLITYVDPTGVTLVKRMTRNQGETPREFNVRIGAEILSIEARYCKIQDQIYQ